MKACYHLLRFSKDIGMKSLVPVVWLVFHLVASIKYQEILICCEILSNSFRWKCVYIFKLALVCLFRSTSRPFDSFIHAAYLKLFFLTFIPDETMVLENLKYTRLLALSSLHKHGKLSFSTSSMEWTPCFVFVAILKPYFSALLILIVFWLLCSSFLVLLFIGRMFNKKVIIK